MSGRISTLFSTRRLRSQIDDNWECEGNITKLKERGLVRNLPNELNSKVDDKTQGTNERFS